MWKKAEDDKSIGGMDSIEGTSNDKSPSSNGVVAKGSSSTIGVTSVFSGEIKGSEDLIVRGVFDGTVNLSNNTVTVSKTGFVKGVVNAKAIYVDGKVEGDLKVTDNVVLRSSSSVKGNIVASRLLVEDGCFFQGGIDMVQKKTAPPVVPIAKPKKAKVDSKIDLKN